MSDGEKGKAGRGAMKRLPGLLLAGVLVLLYTYNFPYFYGIHSANELPRIYQAMAMVDRGALNIDPEMYRYQGTPDTAGYKGKLYPNKAPGMSLLTAPVYWVQKKANGGKTPELMRMFFWFRLFGSILPSLLFLLLLWRFLGQVVAHAGTRRILLCAYALGSMALTYGTLLIAHQLSGLLMASAYILLFLHAREAPGEGGTRPGWSRPLLAGLAAGAGVLVDYQVAFIGPPLFIYALWTARPPGRWRSGLFYALGTAPPLLCLLGYHWVAFDSPFRTGYHLVTNPVFQEWHREGFLGMSTFKPVAFWGSFFRADNGLFYFSPYLLLAFPGLALMFRRREWRADAVLCLSLILFFGYFVSSLTFWRSGWAVGPRYITCALPYYLLPAAVLMARLERAHWAARVIPYGLMALAILLYSTANATFPHYPENFSNPWFDVTLRFGLAGYLPYNLGWKLGLHGLPSVLPFLAALGVLIIFLLMGGPGGRRRRAGVAAGAICVMALLLTAYHFQLRDRRMTVPVPFLPWMERIWEPRHEDMDLEKLLPAGDPVTGGLKPKKPWW